MEQSLRWDTDNDGIIDNAGFADQTYDAWIMTGARCVCVCGCVCVSVCMVCECVSVCMCAGMCV